MWLGWQQMETVFERDKPRKDKNTYYFEQWQQHFEKPYYIRKLRRRRQSR